MCEVTLADVAFTYDDIPILKHSSLTVGSGDFLAVVGPNGAGKSTLLKLIAGLLRPTQGHIFISGQESSEARKNGLIRYVPQNYAKGTVGLPATVEEVVALGLVAGDKQKRNTAKELISHMLDLVGIADLRYRRIGQLSGGQQQRAMVAMALVSSPQLLLLDEPTSGIDYDASTKIYELLGSLSKDLGITVIMVSHDIVKALEWVNKVACINRGLCFFGSSRDFDDNHGKPRHLWYTQVR